jgi:N6-adenosine-specific RNA methylase IME4
MDGGTLPLPTPELTFHEYANLFPLLEGERFDALCADIEKNGLNEPIVVLKHQILDGRNRWLACQQVKAKLKTKQFKGSDDEALEFVVSKNLQRRDLSESQRAMLAVRIANMTVGRQAKENGAGAPFRTSQKEAGKRLGVSRDSVKRAVVVCDSTKTIPELAERVRQGDLTVKLVGQVAAAIPRDEQGQFVNASEADLRGAAKKYKRAKKAREMAEKTVQANEALDASNKVYGVLYSDPPWKFETRSENGMDRSADNHYPTETIEKIKAIKVPAAENAVLFMWATAPLLDAAIDVMRAWGFKYKSNQIWAKPHAGTGFWFRSQHEQLLVGTKGNIPAPAPGEQFSSLIEAPLGEHSVKPEAFAEMIEEMFPDVPCVEMFARRPRLGWDVWGNEALEMAEAA